MAFNYKLNGVTYSASSNSSLPPGAVLLDESGTSSQKTNKSESTVPSNQSVFDAAMSYYKSNPTASAGSFDVSKVTPASTTIPLSTVNENVTPIPVPAKPTPANYNQFLTPVTLTTPAETGTKATPVTGTVDTGATNFDKLFSDYIGAKKDIAPVNQADIYNQTRNEAGVIEKQQKVNNLAGQINAIVTKSQADQLSVTGQGRGVPEAIIGGIQAQISKEAAIQSLPLQAQLSAAQGDLQMAQQHLDTLFKIRVTDAQNQYEFKNKLVDSVFEFASKKEQARLDEQKVQNERAYQEQKTNLDLMNEWSKTAVKTGQSYLVDSFNQLDAKSKTFRSDLSKIVSKIDDPTARLDFAIKKAELEYKKKQTELLGQPTKKELQANAEQLTEAKASLPVMQDKVATIDVLKEHPGLNSRVGTNLASRSATGLSGNLIKVTSVVGIPGLLKDIYAGATGEGQDFAGGVHKLLGGLTLQNLIDAKARGATFGALSEGELSLLASSASAINDWEIKDDKGIGMGVWNIDEESFKKEMKTIQDLTNRAILLKTGTLLDTSEQSLLDNTFTPQNMNTNPANYYSN